MSNFRPISAAVLLLLSATSANAAPPSNRQNAPADAGTAAPSGEPAKASEPAKTQPSPPPAASDAQPPASGLATAQDIKSKIPGNTILGSMNESGAYTEYYDPDGTVVGADYTGKWTLEGDKMCFAYGNDPKECYAVKIDGTKVTWLLYANEIGTGNIVPGNPQKLMGASTEPEAPATQPAEPAAKSEKLDMAAHQCSELVETFDPGPKQDAFGVKAVMYWMAGYTSPDEQGTVYDAKAIKIDTERIVDQCRKQRKMGVLTIATKIMGEKGTKVGRDAVDISALSCKALLEKGDSSKKSAQDEVGLILMWLAGYHSFYNENTIFDSVVFSRNTENIGKFCAENPETSLVTAAKKFMAVETR